MHLGSGNWDSLADTSWHLELRFKSDTHIERFWEVIDVAPIYWIKALVARQNMPLATPPSATALKTAGGPKGAVVPWVNGGNWSTTGDVARVNVFSWLRSLISGWIRLEFGVGTEHESATFVPQKAVMQLEESLLWSRVTPVFWRMLIEHYDPVNANLYGSRSQRRGVSLWGWRSDGVTKRWLAEIDLSANRSWQLLVPEELVSFHWPDGEGKREYQVFDRFCFL